MKRTVRLTESELKRMISESVKKILKNNKRMLREHEEDWFNEDDQAYIGRTEAYYDENDDYIYTPDFWTYDNNPNSKDFAGEVYVLNDEGKSELNWWIRNQRFNEYQRKNAFNPNNNSSEEEWELLTQNYGKRIR